MSLLQYTSKEMFSSTELIRKSKKVFDKLSQKEIEKAIILRDGKPSFMLLDFDMYEKLIEEYMQLKENKNSQIKNKKVIKDIQEEVIIEKKVLNNEDIDESLIEDIDEINDEDLQEALAKIEELPIPTENKEKEKTKDEQLKDFWE